MIPLRWFKFKRPNPESDRPDFTGKILAIYCTSAERASGMFQDARLVQVGFQEFVVARRARLEPPAQERWSKVTVWISIDEIAQMFVFDDMEAATRAFQSEETDATTNANTGGSL